MLTDNGIQFTTPGAGGSAVPLIKEAIANGEIFRAHAFELACARNDIEHRTTKARHPWTNGQVERMNRTIKDATIKRFYYESHDQLRQHLADFDVEMADRVALELLPCRLVALDVGQPADAMTLQAAMQGRARQMRDRRLQRIKTIIERQQRVTPEGDDDRFLLDGEDRRSWLPRSGRQVCDRGPSLPLGDGVLVDPIALGQRPQALLTMLCRSNGSPLSSWRSHAEPGP